MLQSTAKNILQSTKLRNGMESEERPVLKELHNTSEYNKERPPKEKGVGFCDSVR